MLTDSRDSAGFMLLGMGKKPDDGDDRRRLEAIEKIDKANRKRPDPRASPATTTRKDLAKGNLWVCLAYSGDVVQLQADNPNLEFVIPEEGATLWSDNMLIPQKPPHPYAAETFMNYVYDPEVAAKIAAYVNYVTPVMGAKEVLAKSDPEARRQPADLPRRRDAARSCTRYPSLDAGRGARDERGDAAGRSGREPARCAPARAAPVPAARARACCG